MIAIKIECGCGQRYAFDVEPVEGRLPHPVACPVCGADGTAAAHELIGQSQPSPALPTAVVAPVRAPGLTLATPTLAPARSHVGAAAAGLLNPDRSKTESEARSKVLWGDLPEDVVKFVMMQGVPRDEATVLVESLVGERVVMLRGIGTQRIFTGLGLICIPVAGWFFFQKIGVLPMKIFAVMIMAGLYGAYRFVTGTFMIVLPRMERGDVADK